MIVEENWGIPLERIQYFFTSQTDVDSRETGFSFRSCQITLTALEPGQMGAIPIPRTCLRIEGPEAEVQIIHRRFFLQFLSAGG